MAKAKNILIVGYGVAGKSLATSLRRNKQQVKGFLDDTSKDKHVLGKLADVNEVVEKYKITDIYFAIPTASAAVVRKFINTVKVDSVKLSIIPRSFSIISKNTVNVNDLTDVDILSLVGRQPVKHDLLECQALIEGKTIVVTGAAGSIGSRLVRLLVDLKPAKIVCVDWWENGTFYLQQELGDNPNVVYRIADIKNMAVMNRIFSEFQPELVFHAAAYKHVPMMQDNPIEAFNNNVWGSLNLMRQAINHSVQHFVFVSTDKAVNPANVMGSSKRLGEMLLEVMANTQDTTKFNAVRFGNVIQSNGSVMHTFKKQINTNQPVTVTHKEVTRFFMTVEEAAQLIVQSAVFGKNGEIFVLDMGEPVKVYDLARSLIKLSGKPNKIKITGLRSGDKMYEELSYDPKRVGKTPNQKIFIVKDEKKFDHVTFMETIDEMIKTTLAYELTSEETIVRLKNMGFKIQD